MARRTLISGFYSCLRTMFGLERSNYATSTSKNSETDPSELVCFSIITSSRFSQGKNICFLAFGLSIRTTYRLWAKAL